MTTESSNDEPVRSKRLSGAARRALILSAARTEFARSGYHGASTAGIARAAECSEPMLYKHFSNKEALFVAVLDEVLEGHARRFDDVLAHPATAPELVDRLLGRVLDDDHHAEGVRLQGLAMSLAEIPEVAERLRRLQRDHERRVALGLEWARAAGFPVRADVDATYIASIWNGTVLAASFQESLDPGSAGATIRHLRRFLLDLLEPA